MRVIIQRVLRAKLTSNEQLVSEIGPGIMALVGITHGDTEVDVEYLCPKLLNLRLWKDDNDKSWSKSLVDKDY